MVQDLLNQPAGIAQSLDGIRTTVNQRIHIDNRKHLGSIFDTVKMLMPQGMAFRNRGMDLIRLHSPLVQKRSTDPKM